MKLVGNEEIQKQLVVAMYSCISENRPLPHSLLCGAAGCGKTTSARFIAKAMKSTFINIIPNSLNDRDSVINLIKSLPKYGYDKYGDKIEGTKINYPIVFIDEIHRIPLTGQEILGILMEEWSIPIDNRKAVFNPYDKFSNTGLGKTGDISRTRWSPQFTLLGATTDDGLLSKPFKDRFKVKFLFNTYTFEESVEIAKVHAEDFKLVLHDAAAREIAKRGRGVPRIIVKLLERCKDVALASQSPEITKEVANVAFALYGIDTLGLNKIDIKLLQVLYEHDNDAIGLENLSIMLNESKKTINDTTEPFLIQQGLVTRTSRGRKLTEKGKNYLVMNGHIQIPDAEEWVDIPADYKRRL